MKLRIKKQVKKDYYYLVVLIIGWLVFFLSNIYFGWNKTAQSGAERVFDIKCL